MVGNVTNAQTPEWLNELENMVNYYIDQPENYGLAVGIIDHGNSYEFYDGIIDRDNRQSPNDSTIFELGGTAKIFTAHKLLELKSNGQVDFDEPITKYLNLDFENKYLDQITIHQLLTHTSGFDRKPFNLKFTKTENAQLWENYTKEQAFEFLKTYQPKTLWSEGESFEYSDFGYAVLGLLLEAQGVNKDNINSQKVNIKGHDIKGIEVDNWQYPAYLSYSINQDSNLPELMKYIEALMSPKAEEYLQSIFFPREKTNNKRVKVAYAWHLVKAKNMGWNVYTHAGSTEGFRSFIAFNKRENTAVILLANTNTKLIDNIGIQLLDLLVN